MLVEVVKSFEGGESAVKKTESSFFYLTLLEKEHDAAAEGQSEECVSHERVNEQTLNEKEISKIFEVYKRVAEKYGRDHIVEWAISRGRIFLLQARALDPANGNGCGTEIRGERTGGYPISNGVAKGSVRMIRNTSDFVDIANGDVIVTKILSPEFIPFTGKATATVSEYGGLGSSFEIGKCAPGVGRPSGPLPERGHPARFPQPRPPCQ